MLKVILLRESESVPGAGFTLLPLAAKNLGESMKQLFVDVNNNREEPGIQGGRERRSEKMMTGPLPV